MEEQSTGRPPLAWRDPNTPLRKRLSRKDTITPSGRRYKHSRLDSINQGEEWTPKKSRTRRNTNPVFSSDEEAGSPDTPLTPENVGPPPPRLAHGLADLKPGAIIRGQMYSEYTPKNYMTPEKESDHYIDTRWGKVYGEERHMVVINQFLDHYIALPVFTHRGTGTARKRNPFEFVTLHDHRHKKQANPQSDHKTLYTGTMDPGIYLFRRLSVIHITAPVCKKYLHPVVREGNLTVDSTAELTQLYLKYCPPRVQEECSASATETSVTSSSNDFACGSPPSRTSSLIQDTNRRWTNLFSGMRRGSVADPSETPIGSFGKLNLDR